MNLYQRKESRFETLNNVKIEECIKMNDKIGSLKEALSNIHANGKEYFMQKRGRDTLVISHYE